MKKKEQPKTEVVLCKKAPRRMTDREVTKVLCGLLFSIETAPDARGRAIEWIYRRRHEIIAPSGEPPEGATPKVRLNKMAAREMTDREVADVLCGVLFSLRATDETWLRSVEWMYQNRRFLLAVSAHIESDRRKRGEP